MSEKVLDITQIKEILPYRYPMLLVDRYQRIDGKKAVGLKNLTFNELFFQGHFPAHPIFPGVLQVEAIEQVAELAVRETLAPSHKADVYIKSLKKVKFRKPSNPGDRVLIEIEIQKIEDDLAYVKGIAKNASGVSCTIDTMVLSVRDKVRRDYMPELFTRLDKKEETLMDINQVKELTPHRYPFLLVDYIQSTEAEHVVAVKNLTGNEPIFMGYRPDYPVLPGAVQSEIVAQAGGVYVLSRPEHKGKTPIFMSIQEAEFYHPILPGDQLVCEVDIPAGSSRFGRGQGLITVEGKVMSKTNMTFAIIET
jgi:3-hydroxyacyl-[acyl-carrier-protein] dehydratase